MRRVLTELSGDGQKPDKLRALNNAARLTAAALLQLALKS
jgi:hypothetical protein